MTCNRLLMVAATVVLGTFIAPLNAARADLALSQLIVELAPGDRARADVEAWNNGHDRLFVAVDPREILRPGSAPETSRADPDPDKLGLLVSPGRMILEAGQRKLIRIASIAPADRERVYRVTVKPVVGNLSSESSGLKVLVGYDVLVLVRPTEMRPHVSGVRSANQLTLRNDGNVSVELINGRQCVQASKECRDLPNGRLYAGAQKTVEVTPSWTAYYKLKLGDRLIPVQF